MAKVGDASIRRWDAGLREQFTDGAIGNAAFAKRGDVILEGQQPRSTRLGGGRVVRRGSAKAIQRFKWDGSLIHGQRSMDVVKWLAASEAANEADSVAFELATQLVSDEA